MNSGHEAPPMTHISLILTPPLQQQHFENNLHCVRIRMSRIEPWSVFPIISTNDPIPLIELVGQTHCGTKTFMGSCFLLTLSTVSYLYAANATNSGYIDRLTNRIPKSHFTIWRHAAFNGAVRGFSVWYSCSLCSELTSNQLIIETRSGAFWKWKIHIIFERFVLIKMRLSLLKLIMREKLFLNSHLTSWGMMNW